MENETVGVDAQGGRTSHGQHGLDAAFAICESVFLQERRTIFANHWLCMGTAADFSSHPVTQTIVDGRSVIVTFDEQNTLRCFYNICRHRGAQLVCDRPTSSDPCESTDLVCSYHAWRYGLDGSLKTAANMNEVQGFDKSKFGLREIACQIDNGLVWVCLADSPSDLGTFIGDLSKKISPWNIEALHLHATVSYEVQANWKLLFQNYNECYHCPTVHPALNRLTPYKNTSNDFVEGPILGGPMQLSEGSESMTSDGKFAGKPLDGLTDEQKRGVAYYTVFPSLFISLHPDYVLFHRLEPLECGSTKVTCEFLFQGETDPSNVDQTNKDRRNSAVNFWDETNRQDWEVCERVQLGMANPGYIPGPYSNLESLVAAFDRYYLNQIGSNANPPMK